MACKYLGLDQLHMADIQVDQDQSHMADTQVVQEQSRMADTQVDQGQDSKPSTQASLLFLRNMHILGVYFLDR